MPIEEMIANPITGISAFNELVIDAAIWNEAHRHHGRKHELHSAVSHRPGVVYGLEVLPAGGASVLVAPGVAIDTNGQMLVLRSPARLTFTERGQSFVTLNAAPVLDKASETIVSGNGKAYYRSVEEVTASVRTELPTGGFVELARVIRANAANAVKDAASPFDPGVDELSFLHRPLSFPHCYADTTVGELDYVSTGTDRNAWKVNRSGVVNLLREGSGRGFKADFLGPGMVAQNTPAGQREPALLYAAGADGFRPLGDVEQGKLWRLLGEGTLLVGEQVGTGDGFTKSFRDLATALGATLTPVDAKHPLLLAQYSFGAAPAGANPKGELLADLAVGIVLSTFNYGGAWSGEVSLASGESAAIHARERVRQAQEFGLNLLATAAKRRRAHETKQLQA